MAATLQPRPAVDSRYQDLFNEYAQLTSGGARTIKAGQTDADSGRSGPQGRVEPLTIIDDPADWTSEQLRDKPETYTYDFTPEDASELLAAVEILKSQGVATEEDILALTKKDLHLSNLGPKLEALAVQASSGLGFQLVRGFPVKELKGDRLGLILAFYSIGLAVGRIQVSQTDYDSNGNTFGSVINHVTAGRHTAASKPQPAVKVEGGDVPRTALYDKVRLAFHTDQGATDLICLLSLVTAPQGGHSKWVSGIAIHNELLRQGRADLVDALTTPGVWMVPRKVDQAAFERTAEGKFAGLEDSPPLEYHDGYLSVHFTNNNYQEMELTPLQQEAFWAFASIAEDPNFHMSKRLEPGEFVLFHNPTVMHARGDVVDGDTPETIRHLLRLWTAQPTEQNPRKPAPSFAPRSCVFPGGGFRVPEGSKLRAPFFPYSRHDGEGQSHA